MSNNNAPSSVGRPNDPEWMSQRTEFFSRLSDSEISGGNFTVTGGDAMFTKSKRMIINGGNFISGGSCSQIGSRAEEAECPHDEKRKCPSSVIGFP